MYLHNPRAHGKKSKPAVILKEYHPLECCCLISCYYLVSSVNQLEVEKMSHKCHCHGSQIINLCSFVVGSYLSIRGIILVYSLNIYLSDTGSGGT